MICSRESSSSKNSTREGKRPAEYAQSEEDQIAYTRKRFLGKREWRQAQDGNNACVIIGFEIVVESSRAHIKRPGTGLLAVFERATHIPSP